MAVRVRIRKHERGLLMSYGDFVRPLGPGVYWFPRGLIQPASRRVEKISVLEPRFTHPLFSVLLQNEAMREQLEIVELGAEQRALVWRDGCLENILGPGRYAYWKSPYRIEVETFNIASVKFEHPRLEAIVSHPQASMWLETAMVEPTETALLFVKGALVGRLKEGRHAFWKYAGQVKVRSIDSREQVADVAGQEIMTSDKVTLRVNLIVTYQITDALRSVTAVSDAAQALYREAQLVLRAAIGTRKLDELLADKESVGSEVKNALSPRANEFGIAVRSVGLRDIVLPGEMKTILNRVIEAQKSAEAEIIKRREETASARSQANTAKLLAENPTLARMKELELLQGVLANTKATFVFGSGDLAQQVRSLVSAPPNDGG